MPTVSTSTTVANQRKRRSLTQAVDFAAARLPGASAGNGGGLGGGVGGGGGNNGGGEPGAKRSGGGACAWEGEVVRVHSCFAV